jgi:thymidylate kinase
MQMLHLSAHIDTILNRIAPIARENGSVILDRGWWSMYAYLRKSSSPNVAIQLVNLERFFWNNIEGNLPKPIIIYITRSTSLKPNEVDKNTHYEIDSYYREIMKIDGELGINSLEISNDGSIDNTLSTVMSALSQF